MLDGIKKVVVLSGGSGNDAILKALIDIGYDPSALSIIVNAYDDGKSTGVCREVTGTLGVSDIRKNHEKLHKMYYDGVCNDILMKLYTDRPDFDLNTVPSTGDAIFDREIANFFINPKSRDFEYKSFNMMNIIYSQMYTTMGYAATNIVMSNACGLPSMVHLNSFDNMKIVASTEKGNIITDEGDIVEWKNADDKIKDIHFVGKGVYGLNPEALKLIEEADLIIISTGTFWSSLYPTLSYLDFYKYINEANADKLWVVNTAQDKDAYGVSAKEFYKYFENLGLDMSKFDVLVNSEADEILKETVSPRTCMLPLGNDEKGRNDPDKIKDALYKIYG